MDIIRRFLDELKMSVSKSKYYYKNTIKEEENKGFTTVCFFEKAVMRLKRLKNSVRIEWKTEFSKDLELENNLTLSKPDRNWSVAEYSDDIIKKSWITLRKSMKSVIWMCLNSLAVVRNILNAVISAGVFSRTKGLQENAYIRGIWRKAGFSTGKTGIYLSRVLFFDMGTSPRRTWVHSAICCRTLSWKLKSIEITSLSGL